MTASGSSVAKALEEEFGGIPETRDFVVNVAVLSTLITDRDPDRIAIEISLCDTANTVFLSISGKPATQGIVLNATRPSYRASVSDLLLAPTEAWFGTASAPSNVYVIVVRRSR